MQAYQTCRLESMMIKQKTVCPNIDKCQSFVQKNFVKYSIFLKTNFWIIISIGGSFDMLHVEI